MDSDKPFWVWFSLLCAMIALALWMLGMLTVTASAQNNIPCQPFAAMKAMLEGRFQEQEVATGVISNQQIFVLFASARGKTWTMLAVNTAGIACPMASGHDWTPVDRGI